MAETVDAIALPVCRSTPELDQLQAHLSALVTDRMAADLPEQMFPLGAGSDPGTLRCYTLKTSAGLRGPRNKLLWC